MFFSSFFNKIVLIGLVLSGAFVSAVATQGSAEDVASFKTYFTILLSGDIDVDASYSNKKEVEEIFSRLKVSWGRAANYRDKMRPFLDQECANLTFNSRTLGLRRSFTRDQICEMYTFLRPLVIARRKYLDEVCLTLRAKYSDPSCLDVAIEA